MSAATRVLAWLDRRSDDVSPLVVKEARQVVRGREFFVSFLVSLVAGLLIAFAGATDALAGSTTSGRWTFAALMAFLALLGLVVVPVGAFNTLRQERVEQTLELITLTALSSRRVVIGKLLAQSVKLVTLFAAIAPFIVMSFLLGGVDFSTILTWLVLLYLASVWAGALCLFLSTLVKSRAASSLVMGVIALVVVVVLFVGSRVFTMATRGIGGPSVFGLAIGSPAMLKNLTVILTFWTTTLVNFVLLADHRLSLATKNSVSPLRYGFFAQFLVILSWALISLVSTYRMATVESMTALGAIHLAVVAIFVLTEELSVPRGILHRLQMASGGRRLLAIFSPGAGHGAAYVVAQMVMLFAVMAIAHAATAGLHPSGSVIARIAAACGYICFYTGVPVLAFWRWAPARVSPFKLRLAVFFALAAAIVLPDIIHYLVFQPEVLNLNYAARHLINPFTTIANWRLVESWGLTLVPLVMGVTGLLAYVLIFILGVRATSRAAHDGAPAFPAGAVTGRGGILD